MHPPIPSSYTSRTSPKIIYLSTGTPFVSALKRVRSLMSEIDKRGTQASLAHSSSRRGRGGRGGRGGGRGGLSGKDAERIREIESEPVVVKATGKAVAKAVGMVGVLMRERAWRVRVRTGSVVAVDDLSVGEDVDEGESMDVDKDDGLEGSGKMNEVVKEEGDEVPETRIRYTSMLEIEITLRSEP